MSKSIKISKTSNKMAKSNKKSNSNTMSQKKQIRTKSKISVPSKNKSDDINFEDKIEEILEALRENYVQQKNLMNELRILKTLHKKEVKLSSKPKKRTNSGKHTGFNKPAPVPESLKKLLKIKEETLPRPEITRLMYKYFTDNKMYDSETRKTINPSPEIKKIFGMKKGDVMNFYNMQTWIKKIYGENSDNNNILTIDD